MSRRSFFFFAGVCGCGVYDDGCREGKLVKRSGSASKPLIKMDQGDL